MSPARAAVGRVGPVGRCGVAVSRPRRPLIDSPAAARLAASAGPSPQTESATAARARQPRAVSARSVARSRGGQISITARRPTPAARPQPASRSGIAETGAGTETDSTKTRTAAVPPAAKYPLITPENKITNPTTSHGPGGQPGVAGAGGAQRDQDHAADPERQVGGEPAPRRPAERGEHQHRERPEGGEQRGLRLADHLVGEREHGRHHDGRPRRALQRDQAGIVDEGAGYFHPLRSSSALRAWSTRSYTGSHPRRGPAWRPLLSGPGSYLPAQAPLCCASGGVTTHSWGAGWQANGCKDRLQAAIRPPR